MVSARDVFTTLDVAPQSVKEYVSTTVGANWKVDDETSQESLLFVLLAGCDIRCVSPCEEMLLHGNVQTPVRSSGGLYVFQNMTKQTVASSVRRQG